MDQPVQEDETNYWLE